MESTDDLKKAHYSETFKAIYIRLPNTTGRDIQTETYTDENDFEWELDYRGEKVGLIIHNVELI